jgi:hypothetical protein
MAEVDRGDSFGLIVGPRRKFFGLFDRKFFTFFDRKFFTFFFNRIFFAAVFGHINLVAWH